MDKDQGFLDLGLQDQGTRQGLLSHQTLSSTTMRDHLGKDTGSVSIVLDDSVEQGAPLSELCSVLPLQSSCLVLVALLSDIDTGYRLGAGLCLLFPVG